MIYESRAVNFAVALMIAGALFLGLIGLPIYFAVCIGIIWAERRAYRRSLAVLKGY